MKLIAYRVYDLPAFEVVPAPRTRDWMDATAGFAYRCLPMAVANQMGWVIPCPIDFTVTWDGRNDQSALTVEAGGSTYISSYFGFAILTFNIPFIFRTPPGYGLIVRGAPNYVIPGVHPLDGFVETDWSTATFTMNWKITEANRLIEVQQGTPICMLQPYRIGDLAEFETEYAQLASNPELHEAYHSWASSRNTFNARPDRAAHEWQKDYFKEMNVPKLQLDTFKTGGEQP